MNEKNIKTVKKEMVDKMSAEGIEKKDLFSYLSEVLSKDCQLEKLGLPSTSAVAFLESSKAKFNINLYNERVKKILPKIDKMKSLPQKKASLEMLQMMAPKDRDFAVIALNSYLKMDKHHTVDSFYKEYGDFRDKQQEKTPQEKISQQIQNKSLIRQGALEI